MDFQVEPTYTAIQFVRDICKPWIELLEGDEWGESMWALYDACRADYGFSDDDCALFVSKLIANIPDAADDKLDYGLIGSNDVKAVQKQCRNIRDKYKLESYHTPYETIEGMPKWVFGEE